MCKRAGLRRATILHLGAAAFFAEVQASDHVHVHVARQATGTSSAPPNITPTPLLTFVGEDEYKPVTCQPVTLEWFYNGPTDTINLIATNMGVSQTRAPPALTSSFFSPLAAPAPFSIAIGKVDPAELSYTWAKVNVPSGWYIINATMPSRSFSAASDAFFVTSGSDTSCLPSTTTSSTTAASTPTSSSSPSSSSVPILPVPTPVGGSSSNSTMIGAIVGSCVGAVALVAVIFLIWLCYRRRRAAKANGSSSYPNIAHRFNGLSSVDSRNPLGGGKESTRGRHKHHTSSFGTTAMLNGSEEGVGVEKDSIHSKIDPPNPFGDTAIALSSLPVLPQQPSNGRDHSVASSIANGFSPADLSRNPSATARESLDSTTYPPTSPITSHRGSAQHGGASTASQSTTSHNHDSSPASRNRSEAAKDTNKKAHRQSFGKKRKPVPTYDGLDEPSEPSIAPPPVPYSPSSPSPSPIPDSHSISPTSSNLGHYSTRNRSVQDLARPELAHKSSFGPGAQPMHYLIPDMPLPQKG